MAGYDAPQRTATTPEHALPAVDWDLTSLFEKTSFVSTFQEKDDSKPAGLDGSDLDPEVIKAVRAELKDKSKDGGEALIDAMKANRVLGIGERHIPINPVRDFVRDLFPKLKEAGATHLAIEVDYRCQPVIDEFMRTGKLDQSKLKGILNMDQESFVKLLKAARDAGLKIVAVDNRENEKGRDPHMAKLIGDILEADPKNKVILWVGSLHLPSNETDPEWQVVSQLLKKKYSMATFLTTMGDGKDPVARLSGEVETARAVAMKDAPKMAAMSVLAGTIMGHWDHILIVPKKK